MQRTIFIGDVHGCYDELTELIAKIDLRAEDHLYFCGDLINKGPKSREVVEFVRSRPNTWSVIGNHEHFFLRNPATISDEKIRRWLSEPYYQNAIATLTSSLAGHIDWLLALPHIIEKENFILVHGGLHPDLGLDTPLELATMLRTLDDGTPWYEAYLGQKKVIYGHYAVDGLRIRANTIGLDTGCCFGGHLTAYCLENGEIWQVKAHDIYKIPANWKGKVTGREVE